MPCLDRGTDECGTTANFTCHRCNKQICQNHTLYLRGTPDAGSRGAQSTCRPCAEAIVAAMAHDLDDARMRLALAFQQAEYWSEHLLS